MRRAFAMVSASGAFVVALCAGAADAQACGVSGVGGQASAACALELGAVEHSSPIASAAYTYTATALEFSGDRRADVSRHAVSASLSYPVWKKLVIEGSIGMLAGGHLDMNHVEYTFNPSGLLAASATYRVVDESRYMPAILGTLTIAGLFGSTSSHDAPTEDFGALDFRLGVTASKHVTHRISLFAVGRGFGGPIWWHAEGENITGTDKHHFQVGGGGAVALGDALIFVEGIPLGEQALTAGFGAAF